MNAMLEQTDKPTDFAPEDLERIDFKAEEVVATPVDPADHQYVDFVQYSHPCRFRDGYVHPELTRFQRIRLWLANDWDYRAKRIVERVERMIRGW